MPSSSYCCGSVLVQLRLQYIGAITPLTLHDKLRLRASCVTKAFVGKSPNIVTDFQVLTHCRFARSIGKFQVCAPKMAFSPLQQGCNAAFHFQFCSLVAVLVKSLLSAQCSFSM
ncbi:hypothetical protein Q1695_000027 [Nippostrongylus brasiliensis]|nr:hypothetical protein Q1695_000027 [Nippostrongylus brasiliensis]